MSGILSNHRYISVFFSQVLKVAYQGHWMSYYCLFGQKILAILDQKSKSSSGDVFLSLFWFLMMS